jgi:hypothetical protein
MIATTSKTGDVLSTRQIMATTRVRYLTRTTSQPRNQIVAP